ncbi:MAG: metallophosphoesterase [Clostridia bacterium]|nr:metallophosphoesterase [Clostridia bacterium]
MKKRILAAVLALMLVLATAVPAAAKAKSDALRFDENGEFKILHICDCQDTYPANEKMLAYINHMLDYYKPQLVVLGGDNTIGPEATKELAIQELVTPFVEHKVPFTLVFGNHDHEQGVDKATLLSYYQKHGGEYCLAYDADTSVSGSAKHNLPVLASEGNDIKFNVWMFDTGDYVTDENDKHLGYDSVREDQINWYKQTAKDLAKQAGGTVPAIAFQHMIVGEIYEVMFPEIPFELGDLTETYNNGKHYPIVCPDTSVFKGHLFEPPSPGPFNYGQVDAMLEIGDVKGLFVGHDHYNTYEVDYKGIKLINTPGVTHHAYDTALTRGSRLITVKEENPAKFKSQVITYNDFALKDKDFAKEVGISTIEAVFWIFTEHLLLFLKNISGIGAAILYMFN